MTPESLRQSHFGPILSVEMSAKRWETAEAILRFLRQNISNQVHNIGKTAVNIPRPVKNILPEIMVSAPQYFAFPSYPQVTHFLIVGFLISAALRGHNLTLQGVLVL